MKKVLTETIPLRRPLIPLLTARILLDLNCYEANHMLESGEFPYAFDIGLHATSRKFVRVLAQSVLEIQKHGRAKRNTSLETVIASILPPQRERLRGPEIARLLSCDDGHATNLIRHNVLAQTGSPKHRREALLATRESVVRFLRKRRIA